MANRESAMTNPFGLELELEGLRPEETRQRPVVEGEIRGVSERTGHLDPLMYIQARAGGPRENPSQPAQDAEPVQVCPSSSAGGPSTARPITRSGTPLGCPMQRPAPIYGDAVLGFEGLPTWAAGSPGSIFTSPEERVSTASSLALQASTSRFVPIPVGAYAAALPLAPEPIQIMTGIERAPYRPQAYVIGREASFSIFPPSPVDICTGADLARERFRANFEGTHGGPDLLGQYPAPGFSTRGEWTREELLLWRASDALAVETQPLKSSMDWDDGHGCLESVSGWWSKIWRCCRR